MGTKRRIIKSFLLSTVLIFVFSVSAFAVSKNYTITSLNHDLSTIRKRENSKDLIIGFNPNDKVGLITSKSTEVSSISVYDGSKKQGADDIIKTGLSLEIKNTDNTKESALISLLGDANSDGKVGAIDYVRIKNHIMNNEAFGDLAQKFGADTNEDGKISTLDYVRIKNYVMNRVSSIRANAVVPGQHYELTFTYPEGTVKRDVYSGEFYEMYMPESETYNYYGWYSAEDDLIITESEGSSFNYNLKNENTTLVAIYSNKENKFEEGVNISANADTIDFKIAGLGEEDEMYYIYQVGGASYLSLDNTARRQGDIETNPIVIGIYAGGTDLELSIPRYDDTDYDGVYKKYYIATKSAILKGDLWTTSIANKEEGYEYPAENLIDFNPKDTKKGIAGWHDKTTFESFDAGWGTGGVSLFGLIAPNEIVDEKTGEIIEVRGYDYYHGNDNYYEFYCNGKYYYFNKAQLWENTERNLAANYSSNVRTIMIINMPVWVGQEEIPYFMQYSGLKEYADRCQNGEDVLGTFQAVNTGNQIGYDYWVALMEYLNYRYAELGVVDYVFGNEIDFVSTWNVMGNMFEHLPTVDEYTEETYRAIRSGSIASMKYSDDVDMSLSFTHYWNCAGTDGSGKYSYKPLDIIEKMLAKSNAGGNFDWGLALHDYAYNLGAADIFYEDYYYNQDPTRPHVTNDFMTTDVISINNLELVQKYLEQDYAMVDGHTRKVYLPETGVNSKKNEEVNQMLQSLGIMYHYYKVNMLDCIAAYPYYRQVDAASAEGANFGLYDKSGSPKLSAYVWIDIDKLSFDEMNEKYKSYVSKSAMFDEGDDLYSIFAKNAATFGIDYDWNTKLKEYLGYDFTANKFVSDIEDLTFTFNNKNIVMPDIVAKHGAVKFKFFTSAGTEINAIKNAGSYKYKAYVEADPNGAYSAIESDVKNLVVEPDTNEFTVAANSDDVIYMTYLGKPLTVTTPLTKYGSATYKILDSNQQEIETINAVGTYSLVIDAVKGANSYSALAAKTFTIQVQSIIEVDSLKGLQDALTFVYNNPGVEVTIKQTADIDGEGAAWTFVGNDKVFKGTYDGNGKKISNLVITNDSLNKVDGKYTVNKVGLFSSVADGAEIKKLTLDNIDVKLAYAEGDSAYNGAVSLGILAGEVGKDVKIADVTVSNSDIDVRNLSAVDHEFSIGGVIGVDSGLTSDATSSSKIGSQGVYRVNIKVNNLNVNFVENAKKSWIGAVAGTAVTPGYHIYKKVVVTGGEMKMYNPAMTNDCAMGGFIGRVSQNVNNSAVRFFDNSTTNITMSLYSAQIISNSSAGLVAGVAPGIATDSGTFNGTDFPERTPCMFNYQFAYDNKKEYINTAKNLYGFVGLQEGYSSLWYIPTTTTPKVTYSFVNSCKMNSLVKTVPMYEMNITITAKDIKDGYNLPNKSLYTGSEATAVDYFKSDYVREHKVVNALSASPSIGKELIYADSTEYILKSFIAGKEYQIGYSKATGYCFPETTVCFNPADYSYTTNKLTRADFNDTDTVTLYAVVKADNTAGGYHEIIKVNYKYLGDDQLAKENILFLGDSQCAGAFKEDFNLPALNNYFTNPYEDTLIPTIDGPYYDCGGWAYQVAKNHPNTNVYNYAISGSSIRKIDKTLMDEYVSFKKEHAGTSLNQVVIEISTNDYIEFNANAYGFEYSSLDVAGFNKLSLDDEVPANLKQTSLGGLLDLIKTVKKDFPNAKITFVTSTQRNDIQFDYQIFANYFNDAARIGKHFGIDTVDFWNKAGVNVVKDGQLNTDFYHSTEGVHPNLNAFENHFYPVLSAYLENGDTSFLYEITN